MLSDLQSILERRRARDLEEARELGAGDEAIAYMFAGSCVLGRIFDHRDLPTAAIAFHALTPKALAVTMIATEEWRHVARAAIAWGLREARPTLVSQGFTRAECRTMEGHAETIRLLERLGFGLECRLHGFGASGTTFLQYAWRLEDHAYHQRFGGNGWKYAIDGSSLIH